MAPESSTGHVPAWKKLGLKLKKKPETLNAIPKVATKEEPKTSKKRTISEDDDGATPKKQRLENSSKKRTKKSKLGTASTSLNESEPTEQKTESQKPKKKSRKSVSFAADTKSEDGHPELEALPDLKPEPLDLTPEQRRAEKRRKREERAKNRPAAPPPVQKESNAEQYKASPGDPLLSYLSTFHKARSQWKFQKNRETVLLKHVFSVERIPSAYDAALSAYLAGLRGDGAKNRVAEAAKEVVEAEKAELEKIEGQEKEKGMYDSAVSSFQGKLEEKGGQLEEREDDSTSGLTGTWLERLEKRKRAEMVYFLMRGKLSTTDELNDSAQGVKRKRKTRTAIIEDDSSSSESESDSDSEASTPDAKTYGVKKQRRDRAGSSSSSSSSSDSSSESSSESSSDSSDSSSDSDSEKSSSSEEDSD